MVSLRSFLDGFNAELEEQYVRPPTNAAVVTVEVLDREVTNKMLQGALRAVANYLIKTTSARVTPFRLSQSEIVGGRMARALIHAYESWRATMRARDVAVFRLGRLPDVCAAFVEGLVNPPARLEKPPVRRLRRHKRTPTPAEARDLWSKIQEAMDRNADAQAFYQKTMDNHAGDPNFPDLFHGGIVLWMWHNGSEDFSSAKLRAAIELALQGYEMERAGALEERTLH